MSVRVISHLDDGAAEFAAEILGNDGVVALPTETVYGLGASNDSTVGLRRIFDIKGRPTTHPLIVHGSSPRILDEVSDAPSELARSLAELVWPGPLSLLVPRSSRVNDLVTGGRTGVVVRVPAHDFFRRVVDLLGAPIAAPSANRFGRVSPTRASHVVEDLGSSVDLIVDGGPSVIGLESTIVDTTVVPPQVLRHGGIPLEDLQILSGVTFADPTGETRAPGMLEAHYSPQCRIRVAETVSEAEALVAGFPPGAGGVLNVPEPLSLYAAMLYTMLRNCDERGWTDAVAVLPPPTGLGRAIRDRLQRAAASSGA